MLTITINRKLNKNEIVSKHFFQVLNKINKKLGSDYQVSLEATHHEPYIEKPSLFIEIGSSEAEWKDKNAAEIITQTILEAISTFNPKSNNLKNKFAIGIGGPHYCPNFNKIQLEEKFTLSFIAAKYNIPLSEKNIEEMLKKEENEITHALIDWKGCGNSDSRNKF